MQFCAGAPFVTQRGLVVLDPSHQDHDKAPAVATMLVPNHVTLKSYEFPTRRHQSRICMWEVEIGDHGSRISAMSSELRNGRSTRDGYLRGCGLQFGNIRNLCASDPVFARAREIARSK